MNRFDPPRSAFALLLLIAACAPGAGDAPRMLQVERTRFAADSTGQPGALRQTIVEQFNEDGKITESAYRGSDGALQMRFVNYYEDGLRTRVEWRRADSSLALYVQDTYDDQGRVIQSTQFAPDGTFRRGFTSRWSDDGLERETGPTPADGLPFSPNAFYRFNADGDQVSLLEFPEVDSMRTEFTYQYAEPDQWGNWTRRLTLRDGTPSQIEERTISYRD